MKCLLETSLIHWNFAHAAFTALVFPSSLGYELQQGKLCYACPGGPTQERHAKCKRMNQ